MDDPIEQIRVPIRLDYHYTAGEATTRFLRALKEGRLFGQRCPECQQVIVPPRGACARCAVPTEEEVALSDRGTVTTFCVVHIPVPGSEIKPPFVCATIRLDGADIGLFLHFERDSYLRGTPGAACRSRVETRRRMGLHTREHPLLQANRRTRWGSAGHEDYGPCVMLPSFPSPSLPT